MISRSHQRKMHAVEEELRLRKHLPEAAQHDGERALIELVERQPLHEQPAIGQPRSRALELLHGQQRTDTGQIRDGTSRR